MMMMMMIKKNIKKVRVANTSLSRTLVDCLPSTNTLLSFMQKTMVPVNYIVV